MAAFPLEKSKMKTIGVIGPNANSRAALVQGIITEQQAAMSQYWKDYRIISERMYAC